MHLGTNCHRHIWLLSGTGEGPKIAKALISQGWKITVSVVSFQAALPYKDLPLEEIKVGPLEGKEGIIKVLQESLVSFGGFEWVLDATHPFAEKISFDLREACKVSGQSLLRYERPVKTEKQGTFIRKLRDLSNFDLSGQRLLMAIGSRSLPEAVLSAGDAGAIVFARILPTPESLRKALKASLPESHLALFRPLLGTSPGELEAALCRKWFITGVVCRQSGGSSEELWRDICFRENLDLWLIARPNSFEFEGVTTVHSLQEILNQIVK